MRYEGVCVCVDDGARVCTVMYEAVRSEAVRSEG